MKTPVTLDALIAACEARNPKGESTMTARAVNGNRYTVIYSGGLQDPEESPFGFTPVLFQNKSDAIRSFWEAFCKFVPESKTVYWRRPVALDEVKISIDCAGTFVECLRYCVNARLTWDK